ncbi:MAG: coproporphyrinogen III oxidase family protein [Bacteroidales bacterium]|nr:coproporphyrinogen III oxidase family protein [Bacteroidales bacterium]
MLDAVYDLFLVADEAEITVEVNPDDATFNYLSVLSGKFNRLSIGIQSFIENDLSLLGRKHQPQHALEAIANARKAQFENISIDLIYGISKNHENWIQTLDTALTFNPEHISAYALTIEENTILYHKIKHGEQPTATDNIVEYQYNILTKKLHEAGYEHYEISNFSKAGYASKHNSAYWNGKPYLGVGPAAHSFDGNTRRWNVSKISDYCQAIAQSQLPATIEVLNEANRYNEFIMLKLRQKSGLMLSDLNHRFGETLSDYFKEKIRPYAASGHIINDAERFYLPESSFLISDYIISELFFSIQPNSQGN